MIGLALSSCAAVGTYLLLDSRHRGPCTAGFRSNWSQLSERTRTKLLRVGIEGVAPVQFLLMSCTVGIAAGLTASLVLSAPLPALLLGLAAGTVPSALGRRRRARRRRIARDAWPNLIEELRVLTGAAGRSIPHALIEVGLRGPIELRPAFLAAQREWNLTTDFPRTVAVLKDQLEDPTADLACETLLLAAEIGGDLDGRLAALAADRREDLRDRKEAEAKQSGARLARSFVILVPAGMALAGMNVGDGRKAYGSPSGQLLVAAGLAVVLGCWWWAGRIMSLPDDDRVFDR